MSFSEKISKNQTCLISVEEAKKALEKDDVVFLDARAFMPADKINPEESFQTGHIPKARLFDIETIRDLNSPLPHMLPSKSDFSGYMKKLGINENSKIIIYDTFAINEQKKILGLPSAARVLWMLRVMGHTGDIKILNGGLPAWLRAERNVEYGSTIPQPSNSYIVNFNKDLLVTLEEVLKSTTETSLILDARSRERFEGTVPELREGLASGHIPESFSLPFTKVFDSSGSYFPKDKLEKLFCDNGVDINMFRAGQNTTRKLIFSCGSGVTASALLVAALEVGVPFSTTAIYDGSASEYLQKSLNNPIETGASPNQESNRIKLAYCSPTTSTCAVGK